MEVKAEERREAKAGVEERREAKAGAEAEERREAKAGAEERREAKAGAEEQQGARLEGAERREAKPEEAVRPAVEQGEPVNARPAVTPVGSALALPRVGISRLALLIKSVLLRWRLLMPVDRLEAAMSAATS